MLCALLFCGAMSLRAADDSLVSSIELVENFGATKMPQLYWGNQSAKGFSTFKDAVDLAKINALSHGLERPNGADVSLNPIEMNSGQTDAALYFRSGIIHALASLGGEKNAKEIVKRHTQNYENGDQECEEGIALQVFAQELYSHIRENAVGKVSYYNDWIQNNKNSEIVREIVSYMDAYLRDKSLAHVQGLFDYLDEKAPLPDVSQMSL